MHPDIAALAARLGLPPDVAEQLDALLREHLPTDSIAPTLQVDPSWADAGQTFGGELLESGTTEELEPTLDREAIAGRYQDLGRIAHGGMGEIRRVRDIELERTLAMKIVRPTLLARPGAMARFVDEARATAQLQHPGIVPIHDLGTLPDGRVWFTMKEVRGRTLGSVISEVHDASVLRWQPSATGWTFKRLVASFLQTCHAVAYAHERGVVHRDLKPDNVMVGRHGETWVLDWGLAKLVGRSERAPDELITGELKLKELLADDDTVVVGRSDTEHTLHGTIAGTPAYMPPEQARGEVERIDARSDVYALGATLYHLLSARRPYGQADGYTVLRMVREGPPEPVGPTREGAPPLPAELVAACERAMARDPEDRFPSALVFASEVEAWLDGARKREQALELTQRALLEVTEAERKLAEADRLQARGEALENELEPWRPAEDKAEAWALQDRAAELRRAADLDQLAVDQDLHSALRIRPELPEAHAALADRYRARHARAEARRDPEQAARMETLIRLHADALPAADARRHSLGRYLTGGALSLVTDPPGAEVELFRYELDNRRLVEVPVGHLGTTPIHAHELPLGSYLCAIRHPDRAPVRYPVRIGRQAHWDGVRPGERDPTPIWLPPPGYFAADQIYVPAGWFTAGCDPVATSAFDRTELWCDAFAIGRHPVTNAEYMAFLDDLVARGQTDQALAHAPRERAAHGEEGAPIYGFDGEKFSLQPDTDGDVWLPRMPVLMITWHGARAWAAWRAARTDRPWRIPAELEWEKAARGVDGRWFPWGDRADPSWLRIYESARGREEGDFGPVAVDRYPGDLSPYGVRGMGGNTMDWCLDPFESVPPASGGVVPVPGPPDDRLLRVARGGHWFGQPKECRSAARRRVEAGVRSPSVGMRALFRVS